MRTLPVRPLLACAFAALLVAAAPSRAAASRATRPLLPHPVPVTLPVAAPTPTCGGGYGKPGTLLPEAPTLYRRVNARGARGSALLVEMIRTVAQHVQSLSPGLPPLVMGRLNQPSKRKAAFLMHQDGLDADIGLYAAGGKQLGFGAPLTPRTLDAAHTWALVRGFLATGRVQWILLDRRLIAALRVHVKTAENWSDAQVARVFPPDGLRDGWTTPGVVRHQERHDNHIHVHAVCEEPRKAAPTQRSTASGKKSRAKGKRKTTR